MKPIQHQSCAVRNSKTTCFRWCGIKVCDKRLDVNWTTIDCLRNWSMCFYRQQKHQCITINTCITSPLTHQCRPYLSERSFSTTKCRFQARRNVCEILTKFHVNKSEIRNSAGELCSRYFSHGTRQNSILSSAYTKQNFRSKQLFCTVN